MKLFRTQPTFEATSIVPDPEGYALDEVRVKTTMDMAVELVAAGGAIKEVETDLFDNMFPTVAFHEDRWVPVHLKMSEGRWSNE